MNQLVGYRLLNNSIQIHISGLLHIVFGILELKIDRLKLLLALLIPLFRKNIGLIELFKGLFYIINGNKMAIF